MAQARARSAYLGIDLGTSGLKLSLLADTGSMVAESEASYGVNTPHEEHAEADPADWAAALREAASRLLTRHAGSAAHASAAGSAAPPPVTVAGVGVTGQMHGVVLCDEQHRPVRPAMLWPDQRAAETLPQWQAMSPDVRARLANPLVAGMAGPMLSWLRQNDPEALTTATAVTSPKDWLRGLLTGDLVTERSDASATLLWDVVSDDWSAEALGLAGLSRDMVATVVPSDQVVGTTRWPLADEPRGDDGGKATTAADVPVVAGGADTACALTALDAAQSGEGRSHRLVITVGTGIQVVRPNAVPTRRLDPVTHLYGDTDGAWYEMLAVQNGGLALTWAGEALGLPWDEFVAAAGQAEPGARGASFLPFLTGERGGVAPAGSRAGWVHLSRQVGRNELARAAFEALAFTVRRAIEVLGADVAEVLVSGGGAREPWVLQLVADVVGRPLRYLPLRSASAVGAAVLAARGVGATLPVPVRAVEVQPVARTGLAQAYTRWVDSLERASAG